MAKHRDPVHKYTRVTNILLHQLDKLTMEAHFTNNLI